MFYISYFVVACTHLSVEAAESTAALACPGDSSMSAVRSAKESRPSTTSLWSSGSIQTFLIYTGCQCFEDTAMHLTSDFIFQPCSCGRGISLRKTGQVYVYKGQL